MGDCERRRSSPGQDIRALRQSSAQFWQQRGAAGAQPLSSRGCERWSWGQPGQPGHTSGVGGRQSQETLWGVSPPPPSQLGRVDTQCGPPPRMPASARLKGFCSFSRQSPGRTTSRAAAKTGSPGSPDLCPCMLCLGSWDPRGCGTRHHGYHWGHRTRCPRRRPCTQRAPTLCWGRIIQKTKPHPTWEKQCPGLGLLGQRAQPSAAVQVLGNTEGAWKSPQEAAPLGKDRQKQHMAHASHAAT